MNLFMDISIWCIVIAAFVAIAAVFIFGLLSSYKTHCPIYKIQEILGENIFEYKIGYPRKNNEITIQTEDANNLNHAEDLIFPDLYRSGKLGKYYEPIMLHPNNESYFKFFGHEVKIHYSSDKIRHYSTVLENIVYVKNGNRWRRYEFISMTENLNKLPQSIRAEWMQNYKVPASIN